jgi:hypothetical protein
MISDYFQVKADAVYQSPGFISVAQAPGRIRVKPYVVGWNGKFTFYDMPPEHIAQHMSQWLIQENEQLKDEVQELQMDLEKARHQCDWQSGWEKGRG